LVACPVHNFHELSVEGQCESGFVFYGHGVGRGDNWFLGLQRKERRI
jgi:hypothetical protein